MTLEDLGYHSDLEHFRKQNDLFEFGIGRIISEHKDRYVVKTTTKEYDAEILGNLRFTAESRYDLPAVGDWVAISEYDENKALIHKVYPRSSILERKASSKKSETQIIATNIDFGLIVQSVNRDYNINRIERYLTLCNASNIKPILILSKIDLIDESLLEIISNDIKSRLKDIPYIPLSNASQIGVDKIKSILKKGKTYCLLGSSGVGKSTLINSLTGENTMTTGAISQSIDRGKHVTTHRELIVLEKGVLIDNPGMREVGITDAKQGLEMTFNEILELSKNCKFSDCSHTNEIGCAILEAVENGDIDADLYSNFQKMERERDFFESNTMERRKKDKDFGKMIKNVKKQRKFNKY